MGKLDLPNLDLSDVLLSHSLSHRVGLPEHQAQLLDVGAVMAAVETDDLHALGHSDLHPSGSATVAPLSFLDLVTAVIQEPDSVDVILVCAQENLNSLNGLARHDVVDLCVQCGAFHRVHRVTLHAI